MEGFFWLVAFVGALIGGTELLFTIGAAQSALQQGAGAAMALAEAAIPYVLARSYSADKQRGRERQMIAHLEAIANQAKVQPASEQLR